MIHKEVIVIADSLLTEELRRELPALYANEELGLKALARAKFFTPESQWTWYPSEFDGQDTFFGLVIGFVAEYGYFSLSELESARGPMGLKIERAIFFTPRPLEELKEHYEQHGWAL